ncbi:hypothetical protein [Ruania rhizosphaerae]|nr:hypothetical protein [Ruania rhizosphaerae]
MGSIITRASHALRYVCRGCGITVGNQGAFKKCPNCGIKWG